MSERCTCFSRIWGSSDFSAFDKAFAVLGVYGGFGILGLVRNLHIFRDSSDMQWPDTMVFCTWRADWKYRIWQVPF